jgi:vancomycin resistance protein YoaR
MFKVKLPSTGKKDKRSHSRFKILNRAILFLTIPLVFLTVYNLALVNKIFPQVYVAGINLGGKTISQAKEILTSSVETPDKISLVFDENSYEIETSDLNLEYNFDSSANAAFGFTRTGNLIYDLGKRLGLLFSPARLGLYLKLDEAKLLEKSARVSDQINVNPVYPSIKKVDGKNVIVDRGKGGRIVDAIQLRTEIGHSLSFNENDSIVVPVKSVDPIIDEVGAENFKLRAQNLLDKLLVLKFEDQVSTYRDSDLFLLLSPDGNYYQERVKDLVLEIVSKVNRLPQEPVFVFENEKVGQFAPAINGAVVKEELLGDMIIGNLRTLEAGGEKQLVIDIPVTIAEPKTATQDINNLGIKELLGKGTSRFAGSISNRIHNIQLATGKMKGILVPPGETFSFNDTLGDVSTLTGFKQAYIIKEGKTILGDGGGVCQVSTTLFRAALNAGLPIVERAAHAYRVGYYEQNSAPGFDATVYAPHPDLKIKNDTPGHLLIQPSVDTKNVTLVFEIYGTSDGRVATSSKPAVSAQIAPGEDIYTDDPTIPTGTVKQIEHKAWGAKVTFDYKVSRAGEVIYKKTFVSNYQPWQAVYLQGTGPAQ